LAFEVKEIGSGDGSCRGRERWILGVRKEKKKPEVFFSSGFSLISDER
jgi:hypothetical protein